MKKIQILLLSTLFSSLSFGQLIVEAPILEAMAAEDAADRKIQKINMIKRLGEAVEQTSHLQASAALLKKGYEALSTVNKHLTNLNRLAYALECRLETIRAAKKIVTEFELSKLFTLKEYSLMNRQLLNLIGYADNTIKMMDLILGPNSKMSDGERMQLLFIYEKQLAEHQIAVDNLFYEFKKIKNQRIVISTLKKIHNKK